MPARAAEYFLVCTGAFFLFVSSLGLWRLSDFFQRIHAPTKAATLGLASLFAATLISLGGSVTPKAILAVIFIGATAPVGAHYLASTAYRSGVRPKAPLLRDEYAQQVESEKIKDEGPD